MALVVKICSRCHQRPEAPRSRIGVCAECRLERKREANKRYADRRINGEPVSDTTTKIIEAALAAMDRRSWHNRFRSDRGMVDHGTS
jgi:hypothetical protein